MGKMLKTVCLVRRERWLRIGKQHNGEEMMVAESVAATQMRMSWRLVNWIAQLRVLT
jgi:hypothetical protein